MLGRQTEVGLGVREALPDRHHRADAEPEPGNIVYGQAVGYPESADNYPARPEKNDADGSSSTHQQLALFIIFHG